MPWPGYWGTDTFSYRIEDPAGLQCRSYDGIVEESEHDSSPQMRSNIRAQCEAKIERLKADEGVEVK